MGEATHAEASETGAETAVRRVGVVGAGFMGSGIAESAARAGFEVVVHEPDGPPLERPRRRIGESGGGAARRGRISPEDAAALAERIAWTTDRDEVAAADLVVEAIVED